MLARLADFVYRRRRRVVLAWIAALVAIPALASVVGGEFDADYATPGSDSKAASDLIAERFPGTTGDTIDVVWEAPAGVRDPQVRSRVDRFLARASRVEGIVGPERPRISPDGTIAIAGLALDRREWDIDRDSGRDLIDMAEEASGDGLRIELAGGAIQQAQEGGTPEVAGLVAAGLILLLAFGSVVAVGLPLLVALFGLGISTALIGVIAAVVDVPDWSTAVAGLIGIGVGIDYALLILTRFRSALAGGSEPRDALVEAVRTAGRSVLVAGLIVVIAVLGLFLIGVSYMRGVALSASAAVLVVMAASLTLAPAILAMAGRRVDRFHVPGLSRAARPGGSPLAARWSGAVQRRPWLAAIAGTLVLLVLAAPALGLRLGFPDAGNDREGTTTRAAYDLVSRGFGPGANGLLLLTADLRKGGGAEEVRAIAAGLRREPGIAEVSPPRLNPAGDAAIVTIVPTTSPQAEATVDLVRDLREETLPRLAGGSGLEVHLGGLAASFLDQSEHLSDRLPLFLAGVLGLSFLLLLVAFRAPLIAVKAAIMNLLSVGAAYGVVAYAAEGGWFGELLGISTETPVPPFLPVMMFAILFGLSMDYEVFLLSRVREEFLGHGSTARAVTGGVAKTARVITAAAAIMVAVFLAFLLAPETFLKMMGVGLATAIFVDATIVRMILVPAVMQILGGANWWIPAWLDRRLPHLDVEPARS